MSVEDLTEEFDELQYYLPRIEVGDLVRDTIIIADTLADRYIGIVVEIDREAYEEQFQPINLSNHTKPLKKLRKPDRCKVYWFAGDRAGEFEMVPDWFLRVISREGEEEVA